MKKTLIVLILLSNLKLLSQTYCGQECHNSETVEKQEKYIFSISKYFQNNMPDSIYLLLDKICLQNNKNLKTEIGAWTKEVSAYYKPFKYEWTQFILVDKENHKLVLTYSKDLFKVYVIEIYLKHSDPNSKIQKITFKNNLKEYFTKKKQSEGEDDQAPMPQ